MPAFFVEKTGVEAVLIKCYNFVTINHTLCYIAYM